jgi:CheY-like chemotaxis protein
MKKELVNNLKKPKGIFVFVDDEKDEHRLFKHALKSMGLSNQVVSFLSAREALVYLKDVKEPIFAIFSDLRMPVMDGLEFRRIIEMTPELKIRSIPFFFHSSIASNAEVKTAYSLNIQGYLKKAYDIEGTISSLEKVIALWTEVIHPKDLV